MNTTVLTGLLFLSSCGMLVAALRARYRMRPNYTIGRVRAFGATQVLAGLLSSAIGVAMIAQSNRTTSAVFYVLTGFNLILAGAFFWYAATHRSAVQQ